MALAGEVARKGCNVIVVGVNKLHKIITFVFAVAFAPLQAQVFTTKPLVPEIKTLQVMVNDDYKVLPVIDSKLGNTVEISFDYLSSEQPWLVYRLIHCNADWQADKLSEMESAEGFFPVRITDVEPSFNTLVHYFHHRIILPNDEVKLTVSGNYLVEVFDETDEEKPLATARFMVSEQTALVKGLVSANTDIDFNATHQQLTLDVQCDKNKLPYLDAAKDLVIKVRQNRCDDTLREITAPTRTEQAKAMYEHEAKLVFDAGNTYRRFEFTDVRYATLGIDNVRYKAPYYIVNLQQSNLRATGRYLHDKDQHGHFIVNALHVDDANTEAEYFKARFTLDAPAMKHNEVYLEGDFTYGQKTTEFRMDYDAETGLFVKEVLLKQGLYNYKYSVGESVPAKDNNALTKENNVPAKDSNALVNKYNVSAIEGNFYETANEYDVCVYYRPNGARYDRLIGAAIIGTKE